MGRGAQWRKHPEGHWWSKKAIKRGKPHRTRGN